MRDVGRRKSEQGDELLKETVKLVFEGFFNNLQRSKASRSNTWSFDMNL